MQILGSGPSRDQMINGGLLLATIVVGILLIKSVRNEIEANAGKTNIIRIMNHQIKGYFTTAIYIFAELKESITFGQMPDAASQALDTGLKKMQEGVDYVQTIIMTSGAFLSSLVFPYLMLKVCGGFVYAYMIHFIFYIILASLIHAWPLPGYVI